MHTAIEQAKEEIDAAIFSGDAFIDRDNIAWLRRYMVIWEKELKSHEKILDEIETEDES